MVLNMTQAESVILLVLQIVNLLLSALFLGLFSYRHHRLKGFSMGPKAQKLMRVRVILISSYIVVSISILIFTLTVQLYKQDPWYSYILAGGGGPCINSIVLVIELLVLRTELLKQRPYTRCHVQFFTFLAIVSLARFVLIVVMNDGSTYCLINLALSAILMGISFVQLAYCLVKRQSLPKYISPQITHQFHQQQIIKGDFNSERNIKKNISDDFPYLIPFVAVDKGQIRIILQLYIKSVKTSMEISAVQPKYHSFHQSLLRPSDGSKTKISEFISSHAYPIESLKQFYVLCGRFPIQKTINIEELSLPQLAREYQQFLQEVFLNKLWYQPFVLDQLRVPQEYLKLYRQILDYESQAKKESDLDITIGIRLLDDKNAIYCSVSVFRHLWVTNHYQFYLKVMIVSQQKCYYPTKRYSEFQDLHNHLKTLIKAFGKNFQLPQLPKKNWFYWNQDQQIDKRQMALQKYLRALSNDHTLMEIPPLRANILNFIGAQSDTIIEPNFQLDFYSELKIIKGEVTKEMIKNQCVTLHVFKLFHNGIETKEIKKRYSDM